MADMKALRIKTLVAHETKIVPWLALEKTTTHFQAMQGPYKDVYRPIPHTNGGSGCWKMEKINETLQLATLPWLPSNLQRHADKQDPTNLKAGVRTIYAGWCPPVISWFIKSDIYHKPNRIQPQKKGFLNATTNGGPILKAMDFTWFFSTIPAGFPALQAATAVGTGRPRCWFRAWKKPPTPDLGPLGDWDGLFRWY